LNRFKGESKFSTWLYRMAVNASLNHIRNSKKRSIFQRIEGIFTRDKAEASPAALPVTDNPERQLIATQEREAIEQAIDALPENQRVSFTLSRYDELPQAEIAAVMGISEGAIEQLLQRAKANLRKKLTIYYEK
jgi:RNA polymerase sigma-70 factor (ECF subfamily)